jgi:hypothetical protein
MSVRARSLVVVSTLALALPAAAQWSTDPASPLILTSAAGDQNQPKIRPFPGGGFVVSWLGTQATGWDTWVQRIDAGGNPLWTSGGIVAADTNFSSTEDYGLAVDADGNTLVAFRDDSSPFVQIALQKISPSGELLFGPHGLTISASTGGADGVHAPDVVVASDGSYIVSYSRSSSTTNGRAWYQKVSPTGELLWGGGEGVSIAPATNSYNAGRMVPTPDGGVIAILQTSGAFTANRRIHVQKLDGATGAQVWNGGTPIVVQEANQLQIGYTAPAISDGAGGAIVAWYEVPNGAFQCRVQRISADGTLLFPAGGAVAATTPGLMRTNPAIAFDPATNETYMAFVEQTTDQNNRGVYAQKFDATGARQWTDAGLQVTPLAGGGASPSFLNVTITDGGAIVSFFEGTNPSATTAVVKAAKIDTEGALSWPEGVITVNTNGHAAKARMEAVEDTGGASVLVYADAAAGDYDIAVTRINADGSLGGGAPTCPPDWDDNGSVNSTDISAFLTSWLDSLNQGNLDADFNGDGQVNSTDISAFLTSWLDAVTTGC